MNTVTGSGGALSIVLGDNNKNKIFKIDIFHIGELVYEFK